MSLDTDYSYMSDSSLNSTNDPPRDNDVNWFYIFSGSIYFIIAIVGLLGNGTVIYVILRFAKMKTVTNVYILNLAFADNIFLIALVFIGINTIYPSWIFGKVMCHLVYSIDALNMYTSIFCLTLMAIDRYVAVCYAVRASCYRNMRVATIINVSVWILALAAASPVIVFTRHDGEQLVCSVDFSQVVGEESAFTWMRAFVLFNFTVGFVIPLIIIGTCYAMIISRLHKMGNKTGKWEKSRKVNRLVLCVIIVFVILWAPFFIFRIIAAFHFSFLRHSVYMNEITMFMGYMNSCVNPFLYGFLSDSFKKSFKKVWHCSVSTGYKLTSTTDTRSWSLRNPCLGKQSDRSSRARRGKSHEDDTLSGGKLNVYPLTAVTSAVSELTTHTTQHKNGAMGAPSYA